MSRAFAIEKCANSIGYTIKAMDGKRLPNVVSGIFTDISFANNAISRLQGDRQDAIINLGFKNVDVEEGDAGAEEE